MCRVRAQSLRLPWRSFTRPDLKTPFAMRSLGGDADTLACIAGAMAEAHTAVPAEIQVEVLGRLDRYASSVMAFAAMQVPRRQSLRAVCERRCARHRLMQYNQR
jgi:hypothetical protein